MISSGIFARAEKDSLSVQVGYVTEFLHLLL